jgi:hypothetical protein
LLALAAAVGFGRQRVREELGVVGLDQVAVTCRWAFDRSSGE